MMTEGLTLPNDFPLSIHSTRKKFREAQTHLASTCTLVTLYPSELHSEVIESGHFEPFCIQRRDLFKNNVES